MVSVAFFFFFQAEDGIRDYKVTGVQTCALPISAITIPNQGAGTPYPSTIAVSGMGGTISNVTVTLRNLSHTWTRDIDVLLVGPTGQTVIVMSDAGSGGANNVTLTLSDAAAAALPLTALVSGTFRPANYVDASVGGDNFPSPAPAGPYGATLSAFNGQGANGTWSLYVYDDGPGDQGSLAGGWSLTLSTVSATGAAPTISDIADQLTTVDTATSAIPFTVADADTPVDSLTLSQGSSNETLVPTNNIVFGGSGSNRTVTVSPAANQNGVTTITVAVGDGQYSASTNFVVTVNAVNDPPTISSIADQAINVNSSTGPLSFTVGDVGTPLGSLTVSRGSSNATLVPTNNIVFGGSGANRTVTVSPAAGQTGVATITVTVDGGQYSASTSFVVTVTALFTGTKAFTNVAAITIPNQGAGTPYPSTIAVSGIGGTISNVTVTLRNLSHTYTRDIDVLLVGPTGQKVIIMSDAGGGGANNVTLTLSDAAAAALPLTAVVSGTFRPTNYVDGSVGGDNFPNPAPAAPYGATLSAFNGQGANGTWSLYVFDDGPGDQGSLAGGWSLTLSTVSATGAAPTISDIADQLTTVDTATSAIPFTVADADTPVDSLTLSQGSSN